MMKTGVMRQARLCRVALQAASRVQIAPRTLPSAVFALSSTPKTLATPLRTSLVSPARYYSSEAAASSEQSSSPGLTTKFADLSKLGVNVALVEAITKGMKYDDMTEVQSATITAALNGTDLVAQAKTGTGKTLAFLVPVLQRILLDQPELAQRGRMRATCDDIRAIVISPTRELAEQIAAEANKLVRNTGLVVQLAVGGTQKRQMLQMTHRLGCHIMVGTPGRIHDLLSDPGSGIAAPGLKALVLDEADRMMDTGFSDELKQILRFLPDRNEVSRQTLLFSATIPKNVVSLARDYIDPQNFEFVQTVKADEVSTHEKVPQFIVPCRGFENIPATLLELIERESARALTDPDALPFKAIVFIPTTASVQFTSSLLRRLKYQDRSMPAIIDIHSKLTQQTRTRNAEDFRAAKSAILVSSDVTARGLDFPNVSHVIQINLPNDRDSYIHRLGRTGRAGKEGQGWLLCADSEVAMARSRLTGLPIKRNMDLKCATVDLTSSGADEPPQFQKIKDAVTRLPAHLPAEAYRSLLGGAMQGMNIQVKIDEANNLALQGWGLQETPMVGPGFMRNHPHARGLRVGHVERAPSGGFGDRGGFGNHGGFGDRGGDRGGFGNRGGFGDRGGNRGGNRGGDRFDQLFGGNDRGKGGFNGRGGGQGHGGNRKPANRWEGRGQRGNDRGGNRGPQASF